MLKKSTYPEPNFVPENSGDTIYIPDADKFCEPVGEKDGVLIGVTYVGEMIEITGNYERIPSYEYPAWHEDYYRQKCAKENEQKVIDFKNGFASRLRENIVISVRQQREQDVMKELQHDGIALPLGDHTEPSRPLGRFSFSWRLVEKSPDFKPVDEVVDIWTTTADGKDHGHGIWNRFTLLGFRGEIPVAMQGGEVVEVTEDKWEWQYPIEGTSFAAWVRDLEQERERTYKAGLLDRLQAEIVIKPADDHEREVLEDLRLEGWARRLTRNKGSYALARETFGTSAS